MMYAFRLLCVILFMTPTGVYADDSGSYEYLASQCRLALKGIDNSGKTTSDGLWAGGFCLGFIEAAQFDGWNEATCVPLAVTQAQFMRVAVKWADEHPERLYLSPMKEFRAATENAFPCQHP